MSRHFKWVIAWMIAFGMWSPSFADVTTGLAAYYPFQGNANDLSPNKNNGVVIGAVPSPDRFGLPNSAYSFNGTDNYIQIPDSPSLNITGDMTIAAWVNTQDLYSVIFSNMQEVSPHEGYSLRFDGKGKLLFMSGDIQLYGNVQVNSGTWRHVAVTLTGTLARMYVDGVFDTSGVVGVPTSFSRDQQIGASGLFYFLHGFLDDVAIYNRALTSAEVHDLYISPGLSGAAFKLNSTVTFTPLTSTYRTVVPSGCPAGFSGKFTFTASLTNKASGPALSNLLVHVTTLTNGNVVLDPQTNAVLGGEGANFAVPRSSLYNDGLLSPGESVGAPFIVCLKNLQAFAFFVDVYSLPAETVAFMTYGSTSYKYSVVAHGQGAGFEQPGFNDTGFFVGDAAFGSGGGFNCPLIPTERTNWPVNTDLLLRKQFNLDALPDTLIIRVAIDNDVQIFVNGQDVSGGIRTHEGCAVIDTYVFSAPKSILKLGANLLAVRAIDRGTESYVDVQVEGHFPAP